MDQKLHSLAALVETFQARAPALDEAAAFPADNIADLRRVGALRAPLPRRLGGAGAGTEPAGEALVLEMLRLVGRGHLATGRLFEGHVNAMKLLAAYGGAAVLETAAQDVRAGELFGLWVTERPPGLRVADGVLHGGKVFCSGAGHVRRALVTAQPDRGDPVLVLVALDHSPRAQPSAMRLGGMRAAVTGSVDLSGLAATIVGAPGDYLRQPEFSAGAWRTSAVTLGGMEALCGHVRHELAARGRADSPHQLARVGQMLVAQQTALMWVRRAAHLAEAGTADHGDVAAGVNLARIAVEQAALDMLRLAQRGLGLSGFMGGHPAEALMRDLATYLRQPAPDETLTEAAAWHMAREMPA
jgi:alkylation response protein AidB-like acyl-CoA dehydrogenase